MTQRKTLSGWKEKVAVGTLSALELLFGGCGAKVAPRESCEPCISSAGNSNLTPVVAQTQKEQSEPKKVYSIRPRVEYTSGQNIKSTLGIAEAGENREHGEEFFRAYNHAGLKGNDSYTSLGLNLPSFNLGDIKNNVTIFGSFGDREGIGLQSTHTLDDLTLILNAEHAFTGDRTRLGFGVDKKFGDVTLGVGYDNVSNPDINQYLVHGIWDVSKIDQLGAGFVHSDNDTNSLAAFWCHYGPEQKWGTRSRIMYSFGNGSENISFDSIWAQNPTFSQFSSPWILGRADGDMYDAAVVENALAPEGVSLGNRSKGGWVGDLSGSFDLNDGSGNLRGEAGYRFAVNDRLNITPTVSYKHGFGSNDTQEVGAGILAGIGKVFGGHLCLEASVSQPVSGNDRNPNWYLGVQLTCPTSQVSRR